MINKQDVIKLIDDCINKIEDAFTADEAEVILRMARSQIEGMPERGEDANMDNQNKYAELPWGVEDTIENLEQLKKHILKKLSGKIYMAEE